MEYYYGVYSQYSKNHGNICFFFPWDMIIELYYTIYYGMLSSHIFPMMIFPLKHPGTSFRLPGPRGRQSHL